MKCAICKKKIKEPYKMFGKNLCEKCFHEIVRGWYDEGLQLWF